MTILNLALYKSLSTVGCRDWNQPVKTLVYTCSKGRQVSLPAGWWGEEKSPLLNHIHLVTLTLTPSLPPRRHTVLLTCLYDVIIMTPCLMTPTFFFFLSFFFVQSFCMEQRSQSEKCQSTSKWKFLINITCPQRLIFLKGNLPSTPTPSTPNSASCRQGKS